jgi:hypothetical protein
MNETEGPDFVTDEHLEYLDALRESGITNMFGARPYLMDEFDELTSEQAGKVVTYWMHTFSERHADE